MESNKVPVKEMDEYDFTEVVQNNLNCNSISDAVDFDNLTFVNDAVSLSKAMMEDGNINENNNTLEFEYFNFCDKFSKWNELIASIQSSQD